MLLRGCHDAERLPQTQKGTPLKSAYGYVDNRDQSLCIHVHGQTLSYENPFAAALVLHTYGYWYLDPPPEEEGWPAHVEVDERLYLTVNEELRLLRELVRERSPGSLETERIAA